MTEKIIGYLLLVVGVVIILFSGLSVYKVFNREWQPVQPFQFTGISIDLSSMLTASLPPEVAARNRQQPTAKTELISGEMLNSSANIAAHLLLMGFIASIGYKLASLGVMFLRPVNVKLLDRSFGPEPIKTTT